MGSGMCLLWLLLSMDMALVQSNPIPESGSADIPVPVLDTIKELSAQMFGAGPGGLGLSSPVSHKASKPFSTDLTFPYSVTRGEGFTFIASIYNYLSEPMKVTASMPSSDQFQINKSKTSKNSFCLPGGAKRKLSWNVTPKMIGQVNMTVIFEAVESGEPCEEQETVIPKKGRRDVAIQSVLVGDTQKNRLAQWKDVHAESRIAELSNQLPPETQMGTYNIKVEDTKLEFTVDKYALPKYEVNIGVSSSISIMDEILSISVLSRYTYGKKVQMKIEVPSSISIMDDILSITVSGRYTYGKKVQMKIEVPSSISIMDDKVPLSVSGK